MQYSIHITESENVVLKISSFIKVIAIMCRITGYFLISLALFLFLGQTLMPAQIVLGSGIFLWGISHAIYHKTETEPAQLDFDNHEQVLRIFHLQRRKSYLALQLPFSEIKAFCTTQIYRRNQKSFSTVLHFRNGSRWILFTSHAENKTGYFTEQLINGVKLPASGNRITITKPTKLIQDERKPFCYSWSFGFFSRNKIPGYLAVAGFLWAMLVAVMSSDLIGLTAVSIFTSIIMFIFMHFGWRWVGAKGQLEMENGCILYYEKRGTKLRLRHKIPVNEVNHVISDNTIGGGMAIFILRKKEWETLSRIANGEVSVSEVLSTLQLIRDVFKFYTPNLNLSEQLQFAILIETTLLGGRVSNK